MLAIGRCGWRAFFSGSGGGMKRPLTPVENFTSKSSGQILYGEIPSYTLPCPAISRIRPCGSARKRMSTLLPLWMPGSVLLLTW